MNTMKKIMKVAAVAAVAQTLTGCFTADAVHHKNYAAVPVTVVADTALLPLEAAGTGILLWALH